MPLKVIGAGYGRTGTISTKLALEKLGYRTYHGFDVTRPGHREKWVKLLENDAEEKPLPRTERRRILREILDGYDAALDSPVNFFWEDLLEDNPDAKILLNIRNAEDWVDSAAFMYNHCMSLSRLGMWVPAIRLHVRLLLLCVRRLLLLPPGSVPTMSEEERVVAIANFERWNADVQTKAPSDKLLVYSVKEGWEPLCKFLGRKVPDEPFPRKNDRVAYTIRIWKLGLAESAKYVVPGIAALSFFLAVLSLTPKIVA